MPLEKVFVEDRMSLAVTLINVGLMIGLSSFCFAFFNLLIGLIGGSARDKGYVSYVLWGHITAMVAMAFGGLLFLIGLVLALVGRVLSTLA